MGPEQVGTDLVKCPHAVLDDPWRTKSGAGTVRAYLQLAKRPRGAKAMKTTRAGEVAAALLAGLVLTGSGLRADEAEDRAVRAVEKLGGKVTRDEKVEAKPVIRVD